MEKKGEITVIKEEICSKEVCLLVEKNLGGTKLNNVGYYDDKGNIHTWNEINFDGVCQAFNQSVVMRWLRENKDIFIDITLSYSYHKKYKPKLYVKGDAFFLNDYHKTYEEAAEAALKYCLNNLV